MNLGANIDPFDAWLSVLPNGWSLKKIGREFSCIGSGTTPPTDSPKWYGEGYPWVTTGELRENLLTATEKSVTLDATREFTTLRRYPPGTLLVAMYGATIGRLALLGCEATTNQACCALSEPLNLEPKYVFYWLQAFREQLIRKASGGGQPNVNQNTIRELKISAPVRASQQFIANFLDDKTARIDALIAEKEQLLELLNEHRLSVSAQVLAEAPSGLQAKLGFCVDLLPGYAFPSDEFSRDAGNIPLLRGINVAPASIRWDETVYWPREYESSLERFRLQQGDVVLGMDRPWISSGARVAMIDEDSAGSFLLQRVCRLRGGTRLTQRFLFFALVSDEFRQSVEVDLTGVSVPHLSPEQILRFKVPVLTVDEQRVRCDVADRQLLKIEQLEAHTLQMLDRLREYRSSLISAAVTGQLPIE